MKRRHHTPRILPAQPDHRMTREELVAVALARGCRHYAPVWPEIIPADLRDLPHEILGCALLWGRRDAATFQAIRCGAMVLSDLSNAPERIAGAAVALGVAGRVAHLARLGLRHDRHPVFWQDLVARLPAPALVERQFLPGRSRFTLETFEHKSGRMESTWLRTAYPRTSQANDGPQRGRTGHGSPDSFAQGAVP